MNWRTRRTKYSPSCPLVQTSGRKYRTVLTTGRDENTNCPLGNEHTISPDSEIGPSDPTLPGHSWGQYLVGTIPRSIRICVPNVVMIGPAVWPPILDRHTHTHTEFVLYRYTSWIPGFARDPLSRSLSPSLSRPSLPSLLFVPAFYPPSLGLPGFAQDNCIPEILFIP